ncbi:50S ribosomal protein L22 [Euzebya tangerina]|uniref:50S ribosomal protein L22 n=1 Tax=Euzebya tangerina TaxID=591198 RepID=UPI000E31B74F
MRISSPDQARAVSRHVRVSPYKARQVATGLRGMSVEAAQRRLEFTEKNAATPVLKTLNSAIANAENNQDLDADDLFVLECKVDEGPTLKRFQPRAMGRAYRIRKRTCHITITVGLPPRDVTTTDMTTSDSAADVTADPSADNADDEPSTPVTAATEES